MLNIPEKPEIASDVGYRWIASQQMTLAEWALIPANPIQRDTEKRARTAKHLSVFNPAHLRASLCLLPDGRRFKADAHTRTYMWVNGMTAGLPDPIIMNVDVYACRDVEAVRKLYTMFDIRVAVETAQDCLFGIANESGLKFKSPMMRAHRFGTAIKRLYVLSNGYTDLDSSTAFTHKVVNYFRKELSALDALSPKHADFVTPIVMVALLTMMKDGGDANFFWSCYIENKGIKNERGCDGVQAMRNLLSLIRERKQQGSQHDVEHLGRGVNAYQMFRGRNLYESKGGVPHKKSKAELDAYIASAVRAKEGRAR